MTMEKIIIKKKKERLIHNKNITRVYSYYISGHIIARTVKDKKKCLETLDILSADIEARQLSVIDACSRAVKLLNFSSDRRKIDAL